MLRLTLLIAAALAFVPSLALAQAAVPGPSLSLGFMPGVMSVHVSGIDFNTVADTPIPIALPAGYTRWKPLAVGLVISNPSISMSTAAFGVFSAVSGGGTTLVGATTTVLVAGENTTNDVQVASLLGVNNTSFNFTTVYLRVTTPQGAAATADVTILIEPLP